MAKGRKGEPPISGHEYLRRRGLTPGARIYGQKRGTPNRTERPTRHDLDWAAGFLEGEASFRHSHVAVRQVQREPLDRLARVFGGRVLPVKQHPRWNLCHYWGVSGSRARGVMLTLFVLLSTRRRQQIRAAFLGGSSDAQSAAE